MPQITPASSETAVFAEILPTELWIEPDLLGARHVMLQHQGLEPFCYAIFPYDHRYTSNSGTFKTAESVALGATAPVEHRASSRSAPAYSGQVELRRLTSVGRPVILRNSFGESRFGTEGDVTVTDAQRVDYSPVVEQNKPALRRHQTTDIRND